MSATDRERKIPEEAEQKTVLVQKTIEKPKPWLGGNGETYKPSFIRNGNQEVPRDVETKEKEKGSRKQLSDSEELGMRVITIAGENKGAYMEIIQSPKKNQVGDKPHLLHNKGNSQIRNHGSDSESSSGSDKEGKKKKDKGQKGKVTSSLPMSAFMNSNVQSVNNSILYNCSCTQHDPGVHLSLSRKPFSEFQVKDRINGGEK